MDKIAQQRTFFSKVRDKLNLSGRVLEELNIEFANFMNKLRETDEKVREQATDVKEAARNAVSFVRNRDYLRAAANISAFHERVRVIAAELQHFNSTVDLRHYGFLLDQLPDEDKHKLFQYNPSAEIKVGDMEATAEIQQALIKQAGISDWWFQPSAPDDDVSRHNVAAKALEKRFKVNFIKELKKASISMADKTYKFYKYLIAVFKKLGWAVATRKIDKYMLIARDFIKNFEQFHKAFIDYYTKQITPIKDQQEKVLQAERARKAKEEEYQRQLIMNQPAPWPHQPGEQAQSPNQPAQQSPQPVSIEPIKNTIERNYPIDLTKQKEKEKLMYEPQHLDELMQNLRDREAQTFITTIEKFASNNQVGAMISTILAQSEALEDTNPNKSLQLLAIAEGMIEEYKTAGIMDFFKNKKEEKPEQQQQQQQEGEKTPPLAQAR